MIIKKEILNIALTYPLEQLYPLEDLIFFDIETTGLSAKTSSLYLIGALSFQDGTWQLTQWLARNPDEEADILKAFLCFAADYKYLVHFNGDTFDLPYLKNKCITLSLDSCLDQLQSIDLYKLCRPLKKLLKLMKMNLTSLEIFLDIYRNDEFTGGELIPVYQDYVHTRNLHLQELLLLHNHDDLLGTVSLLPLLSYLDMRAGNFKVIKVSPEYEQNGRFSVAFEMTLHTPLPKPISNMSENGYLTAQDSICRILVYGISGTLKHFFANYKDYYYLPAEDTAMHKSVASYVDKAHRIQAKKTTCYCKKSSNFLPAMKTSAIPIFKADLSDKWAFIECTDSLLEDLPTLHSYISDFLQST